MLEALLGSIFVTEERGFTINGFDDHEEAEVWGR